LIKIGHSSGFVPFPLEYKFFGCFRLLRQGFDSGIDFVKSLFALLTKFLKGGTELCGELVGAMSLIVFRISFQKFFTEFCLEVPELLE